MHIHVPMFHISSAVAEQVLDHCIGESDSFKVREDTYYSVVYNYEFLEDVHEESGPK